jgi:hypothetical protein
MMMHKNKRTNKSNKGDFSRPLHGGGGGSSTCAAVVEVFPNRKPNGEFSIAK